MPDLVRKWKEQNPFFAALDEEAEKERKRRQEEQQRQEARRRYQEEQQRQEEERRREESATVTPDWRERDAERGLTPPVPSGGNGHTADLEAEFQRRNGRGNRLTPFQEYMRATVASMPEQEETRSTDELRRDMNRQNRLARATNRMAADMGNQLLRDQSGIYDPVRSTNLGVMARTMETQQEKADRATELYRTESTRRRWQEEQEKYASLLSNPDFAAKSGADETIGRNLTAASPAERLYRTITKRSDDKSNAKDRQAAEFVTDEEASIFYYLWNTQGARAAKAYYDDYVHNRASERRAVEAQRQAYEFGRNDMLGSSAESVVGNFASGVGLLDMAWQNLARSIGITDPNKPLNYYSAAQLPSLVSDSIRSGVADQLAEYFPKLSIGKAENATNVVSFLYQTGMSMADSGVSILLNMVGIPEAATLANMGAIAGTRAIRDARERGASDGQALAFGISSAIMEGLFEKISLDKILEPSTATKLWPRVKNAIDQMFTEGSEEVMTTLANTAFDQLIMGDKSELFTRQRRLMEQGVSEKEALRAAMLQWGTEVLGDLLGGMISGLGMGGTKEIATGLRYAARDAQTAREMTDVQNREAAQAREQALRTAYEQAPLTIGGRNVTLNENRQEVNNGQGQQAETAASAGEDDFRARAETAAEGARRSYLDRIERSSGLGRLLQDLRNYRIVRGAENRASEVARIRNQAETGNHRKVSALDYGIENGTADMTGVEIDNVTLGKALGRNWTRAVDEFARQGVTLKGITGQLMKADGTQVRAFFSGDGKTIVVQVDNPRLSWNQLLDHEDLHRRIKENPSYRKAVEDALLADKKRQAYLPEIIDRYAQAYARIAPQLSSDDVIEELLADYRAGFDMLDPLGVNPITARAAKRGAKDIRAVERKAEKGGADNPLLESQQEGKASTEPDWVPKLTDKEWNLAKRLMENYAGNDYNEDARYALKSEKGRTVFVIYSTVDDGAMLFANSGKPAVFANIILNGWKEGTNYGANGLAGSLDRSYERLGNALKRSSGYNAQPGNGGGAGGIGTISNGQQGPNTARRRGYIEGLRDTEYRALINTLKKLDGVDEYSTKTEGKSSTEIDTDYMDAVNSGDMETAQRMEPTEQNGKPRKDETAWQAYLSRYEREAEKRGADNPLLESQQEGKFSTEIGEQDTEAKRREARRKFQQKFTGKSIPTGRVTLTASDHAFLGSELKSGNGTLASDGESGYISNANYGYYFMLNRNGDALIYRKLDADDLYKINHDTEVRYGSGKDASPADRSLQGGRGEYGYDKSNGGQSVRRGGYAGNDQLDGTEQSDRGRSTADVQENRAPVDRINPISKTSYHSNLDDLMYDFSTNDGRAYENDIGASDAAIEAEANEGKASREVDPNTLNMLNRQDLTTVYRAMQVVNSKPRKDETAWQAYLNRYEREAAELLRIHAAGPKSRDTVWMQCLRRYEEEQRRKEARKIAEIPGDVPAEHAQLPVEEPGWIM